ncbi:hypothetical protein VTH82DRAFT_2874 [Thermothelomyces myriococcoides]
MIGAGLVSGQTRACGKSILHGTREGRERRLQLSVLAPPATCWRAASEWVASLSGGPLIVNLQCPCRLIRITTAGSVGAATALEDTSGYFARLTSSGFPPPQEPTSLQRIRTDLFVQEGTGVRARVRVRGELSNACKPSY